MYYLLSDVLFYEKRFATLYELTKFDKIYLLFNQNNNQILKTKIFFLNIVQQYNYTS